MQSGRLGIVCSLAYLVFEISVNCNFYVFFKEVTVNKRPGEKLGMSIKGGMKNFPGDESNDEGIFISKVSSLFFVLSCYCSIGYFTRFMYNNS